MKKNIGGKQIQELFQEGNLVARSLYVGNTTVNNSEVKSDFQEFENELKFLGNNRKDGNYKNVEREGQRNRSATLLVPGVDMTLFADIGLLYDADKSTIKAYMYHDSVTTSQVNHEKFYNVNEDKAKFEPILSKKDFLNKYKDYRAATDNTNKEHVKYNEVLGNFFPESMCGLVAKDNSPDNKLKLLEAKQLLSEKHGVDLPMIIMDRGKVNVWQPDLNELSGLLNYSKTKIEKIATKDIGESKESLLQSFIKNLGFSAAIEDFSKQISSQNISPLNKNDTTAKELVDFLHENTGIPKGGKFTHGIEGRLITILNTKHKEEGLEQVKNLANLIINKKDVNNLVCILDKELGKKDKNHTIMNDIKSQDLTEEIMHGIADKRSGKNDSLDILKDSLQKHLPGSKFSKIREFFNKIATYLNEKLTSNKAMHTSMPSQSR